MRVRDLTRRLAEAGNSCICDPQVLSDAAARVTRLLDVPGPEPVKRALMTAVAELHIEAGWAAFDAGLYRHALHHYARALTLAKQAGDAYCQATALGYAGLASVEHGYPDDGLKLLQCGQIAAWGIPADDQRAVVVGARGRAAVEACALADSATALALLGKHDAAGTEFAKGRDLWTPTRTDPFGDLDRPAARLALARGRLDLAEQLAAASMRRWEGGSLISRTHSGIVLATVHVTAGEPRGLRLAHDAITNVTKLSSARARRCVEPLAAALEAQPGSDARELARMARQVAA
jgi:tetratricopeptide (TPR) repeat protein